MLVFTCMEPEDEKFRMKNPNFERNCREARDQIAILLGIDCLPFKMIDSKAMKLDKKNFEYSLRIRDEILENVVTSPGLRLRRVLFPKTPKMMNYDLQNLRELEGKKTGVVLGIQNVQPDLHSLTSEISRITTEMSNIRASKANLESSLEEYNTNDHVKIGESNQKDSWKILRRPKSDFSYESTFKITHYEVAGGFIKKLRVDEEKKKEGIVMKGYWPMPYKGNMNATVKFYTDKCIYHKDRIESLEQRIRERESSLENLDTALRNKRNESADKTRKLQKFERSLVEIDRKKEKIKKERISLAEMETYRHIFNTNSSVYDNSNTTEEEEETEGEIET